MALTAIVYVATTAITGLCVGMAEEGTDAASAADGGSP